MSTPAHVVIEEVCHQAVAGRQSILRHCANLTISKYPPNAAFWPPTTTGLRRAPRTAARFEPAAALRERGVLRKPTRRCAHAHRNPVWKWDLFGRMTAGTRVDLTNPRQGIRWKTAGQPDKGRPDSPVDEGDLSLDQATDKDVLAVAHSPRHREDLTTIRMGPPVAANRLSRDGFGKRGTGPVADSSTTPCLRMNVSAWRAVMASEKLTSRRVT